MEIILKFMTILIEMLMMRRSPNEAIPNVMSFSNNGGNRSHSKIQSARAKMHRILNMAVIQHTRIVAIVSTFRLSNVIFMILSLSLSDTDVNMA